MPLLPWIRARWVFVALAVAYLYAFPYFEKLWNANELPRILTTIELAEEGSFRLDGKLGQLESKMDVSVTPENYHYQNKAPGLSVLALVPYYPLALVYRAWGQEPPRILTTWLLRVVVVTLPCFAFLLVVRRVARRFTDDVEAQNYALLAYALGSMAFPYALLFMSHAPAAALVGTAFACAIPVARRETASPDRGAALVGALLGLAMFVEYQAIFGAIVIGVYLAGGAERRVRTAAVAAAGALPFLVALAVYHAAAFGSPFRTGYTYAIDVENHHVGFMGIVGFTRTSLAQLFTHASNGLLVLSPWVTLSAVGAVALLGDREWEGRREARAVTAIAVIYLAFVAALKFGRGGWSVGPRYMAVGVPFLAWLAGAGFAYGARYAWFRVLAYGVLLVGIVVNVGAATTYPHWPDDSNNPIFEVSLRLLREGHAPYSLGTAVGLQGFASLAPLYALVAVLVVFLLGTRTRQRLELAPALAVAVMVLAIDSRVVRTPPERQTEIWQHVLSTLERP
jgi:hypothetical protein